MSFKFLLIAGFSDSLIAFRKPLIVTLLDKVLDVHVAAPELSVNKEVISELTALGVVAHDISMKRRGMNPIVDLRALLSLWKLMRCIKPHYFLGYTIKPVIYGTLAACLAHVVQRFALITGLGFALLRNGVFSEGWWLVVIPSVKDTLTCVVYGSGVDIARSMLRLLLSKQFHVLLIAHLLGDKGVREICAGR